MSETNLLQEIVRSASDALARQYWNEHNESPERLFHDLQQLVGAENCPAGFWDQLERYLKKALKDVAAGLVSPRRKGRQQRRRSTRSATPKADLPDWSQVRAILRAARAAACSAPADDTDECARPEIFTQTLHRDFCAVACATFRGVRAIDTRSIPVGFDIGAEGSQDGGGICWLDLELLPPDGDTAPCACHPAQLLLWRFRERPARQPGQASARHSGVSLVHQSMHDAWNAARDGLTELPGGAGRWALRPMRDGEIAPRQNYRGDSLGPAASRGWSDMLRQRRGGSTVFTLGCIERDANDCWQARPIDDDVVKAKVRALAPVIKADTCRVDRILVAGAGNRRAAEDALRAMGLLAEQKDAPGIDVADVLAPADSPLSH